jgi:GNAT superfamily N-acetyltransferase
MTLRRASGEDAATLAALNTHVQSWHAAQYPDVFFARPDPAGLAQWFADRLADPACTAFLVGDPPAGYALCSLQTREASVFSPAIRRLMVDHVGVAPEARRQGHGRRLLGRRAGLRAILGWTKSFLIPGKPTPRRTPFSAQRAFPHAGCSFAPRPDLAPGAWRPYLRRNGRRTTC